MNENDQLSTAKGFVNGFLLSLIVWGLIGLAVYVMKH